MELDIIVWKCTGVAAGEGKKKKKKKEGKENKSRKRTAWFYISGEDPPAM
jgi:hypothetical protein